VQPSLVCAARHGCIECSKPAAGCIERRSTPAAYTAAFIYLPFCLTNAANVNLAGPSDARRHLSSQCCRILLQCCSAVATIDRPFPFPFPFPFPLTFYPFPRAPPAAFAAMRVASELARLQATLQSSARDCKLKAQRRWSLRACKQASLQAQGSPALCFRPLSISRINLGQSD
jgi:hypothetical protein